MKTDLIDEWRKAHEQLESLNREIAYLEYLIESRKRERAEVSLSAILIAYKINECK